MVRDSRRAVEPVEDVGQVLLGDAGALVGDLSVPLRSATVTVPSGGLHFAALSSRLVIARSSDAGSPVTHHGVEGDVERDGRRAAADPVDGPRHDVGEVDRLEPGGDRLVAGQLGEVADQRGQLVDLEPHVVQQLGARLGRQPAALVGLGQQVEVGAQRGQRGAQLVAGVGDQLALPVARGGQRGEHRVEGVASRAISSLPSTWIGSSSSVRAISSAASLSRRTGRRPLRATAQPARAAVITPTTPTRNSSTAELAERVLRGLQRLRQDQRGARLVPGHGAHPVGAVRRSITVRVE